MSRSQTPLVLITGGAGFIGSHVIDRLMNRDCRILVLDDFSTGKLENLSEHIQKITVVKGDIRSQSFLDTSISDVEAIIHLAAIVDHEACLRNPDLAKAVNADGTLAMLEAARKLDVSAFVYASSAALYGEPRKLPVSEEMEPAPLAPYGTSKLLGEQHCLRYFREYGIRTVCLRFFNVFGPRQSAKQYSGVITEFMKRLSKGEPPAIQGDGFQTRDFVNVADVADAILLALDSERKASGIYNIATGNETTINNLADILIQLSDKKSITPIHELPRKGDIRRSVADITKARAELGFNPKTILERDLSELWEWYRKFPS